MGDRWPPFEVAFGIQHMVTPGIGIPGSFMGDRWPPSNVAFGVQHMRHSTYGMWFNGLSSFGNAFFMDVSVPDHNLVQQSFRVNMRWRQDQLEVNQRFEAGACRYRRVGQRIEQRARSLNIDSAFEARADELVAQMRAAVDSLSDWQGVLNLQGLIRQHVIDGSPGQNVAGFWGSLEVTGKPTAHFGAPLGQRLSFRRGPWESWPTLLPVLDQPDMKLPMIFSPYCAGSLHEAIGHALEADYLRASPLKHKLGDRLTPAALTVEDQPDLEFGAGSMLLDDAGLVASRTTLVQQGILVGTLAQANGVLRRERFRDSLQQRASNFVIRNGDQSPDDWLKAVPQLLYISWVQSGNWLPGTQRIKLLTGPVYLVKDGVARAFTPWAQLSFKTTSLLQRIEAVGNDWKRDPIVHFCVKGHQRVPMSLVSPSLLLEGAS